jgi:hypothetical protein
MLGMRSLAERPCAGEYQAPFQSFASGMMLRAIYNPAFVYTLAVSGCPWRPQWPSLSA